LLAGSSKKFLGVWPHVKLLLFLLVVDYGFVKV
jgi:hypothetical protein